MDGVWWGIYLKYFIDSLTTISPDYSFYSNHTPLVNKNHETFLTLFLRVPYKKAEVPAKNTNTGAQKCVIHLVKNNNGVVAFKSVGLEKNEPKPKYVRAGSRAMITITMPLRRSIDSILYWIEFLILNIPFYILPKVLTQSIDDPGCPLKESGHLLHDFPENFVFPR